jgi:hypothetical protein
VSAPVTDAEEQAKIEACAAAIRDCEAYCRTRGVWPVAVVGRLPNGTPVLGGEVIWVPIRAGEEPQAGCNGEKAADGV